LKHLCLGNGAIINVGSNVGLFAVHLASSFPRAAEVVAIEPNPEAFRYLEINLKRNKCRPTFRILQACISNKEEEVVFEIVPGKPEYSSIGQIVHPSVTYQKREKIALKTARLESLIGKTPVAFIFVDVEGAEKMVLQGAESILREDRPPIIFECYDFVLAKFGTKSSEIGEYLRDLGYEFRSGSAPARTIRLPYDGEVLAFHPKNSPFRR